MWTAAALASEASVFSAVPWRLVESQAHAATVRVTDTLAEQIRLEVLLDHGKPAWPADCAGYDFLIATPFRYWPYDRGSRFRRARQSEGVFYASEKIETAVAEMAFYHALFYAESPAAQRPTSPIEMTGFSVRAEGRRALDLTRPPFDRDRELWQNASNYAPCQDFADRARAAAIELIRYRSVRCPRGGTNLAILAIGAIVDKTPVQRQTWHIFLRDKTVQAWAENPKIGFQFDISVWADMDDRLR